MKFESLDDEVQAELRFQFRKVDFKTMGVLADIIGQLGGEVEMENDKGEKWRRGEMKGKIFLYFNKEYTTYKFRFKGTARQLAIYADFFNSYPESESYFQLVYPEEVGNVQKKSF